MPNATDRLRALSLSLHRERESSEAMGRSLHSLSSLIVIARYSTYDDGSRASLTFICLFSALSLSRTITYIHTSAIHSYVSDYFLHSHFV